jgi:hypothetical protein
MRLNSPDSYWEGEDHRYMMIVIIGSNPVVATRMVRSSIGLEYRSFTPGVVSSSLTGPTKIIDS